MSTTELKRYQTANEAPAGPLLLPCPACGSGWGRALKCGGAMGAGVIGPFPCDECKGEPPPPPDVHRSQLEVDDFGRVIFRPIKREMLPWQALGISDPTYRDVSLCPAPSVERWEGWAWNTTEKGGVRDRRNIPGGTVDAMPGIVYLETAQQAQVVMILRALIEGRMAQSVLLHGNNGTGKTLLAMATAQDLVRTGKRVYVLDERRWQAHMLEQLRLSKIDEDGEARAEYHKAADIMDAARKADVLIHDELAYSATGDKGTLPVTIARELFKLGEDRRNAGRITIYTSNCTWEGLDDRLGAAYCSRLHGEVGLHSHWIVARDWRVKRPAK